MRSSSVSPASMTGIPALVYCPEWTSTMIWNRALERRHVALLPARQTLGVVRTGAPRLTKNLSTRASMPAR